MDTGHRIGAFKGIFWCLFTALHPPLLQAPESCPAAAWLSPSPSPAPCCGSAQPFVLDLSPVSGVSTFPGRGVGALGSKYLLRCVLAAEKCWRQLPWGLGAWSGWPATPASQSPHTHPSFFPTIRKLRPSETAPCNPEYEPLLRLPPTPDWRNPKKIVRVLGGMPPQPDFVLSSLSRGSRGHCFLAETFLIFSLFFIFCFWVTLVALRADSWLCT